MAKKITFTNHSKEELLKFVSEKREALRRLQFAVAGSKNRNVKEAAGLKREIARALTELNSRTE